MLTEQESLQFIGSQLQVLAHLNHPTTINCIIGIGNRTLVLDGTGVALEVDQSEPTKLPGWSNQDPREVVSKRAEIAICANSLLFKGTVEAKHSYYVLTDPPSTCSSHWQYQSIFEDMKWPEHWHWIRLP